MMFVQVNLTHGQISQPEDFNFFERKIISKNDTIHYYVFGEEEKVSKQKKPLLIYLQGSGAAPIITTKNDGSPQSSSLMLYPKMVNEQFHYVVIGKPGIKFADSLNTPIPDRYYEKMSYDYRVKSINIVINDIIKENFIDTSKLVLFGHSEGGQIAPKIAHMNKHVTHIVCLSGTAINQMYDFLIDIRKKERDNEFTAKEAEMEVDSLMTYYKQIMKNPTSIDKFFAGHTFLRWSSTVENPPLDYMLKLDIPIYVVAGGKDNSAPIENMDNIPIEFMKNQKTNLTYKYYPKYDHFYNEVIVKDDKSYEVKNHIVDVMTEAIKWLNKN